MEKRCSVAGLFAFDWQLEKWVENLLEQKKDIEDDFCQNVNKNDRQEEQSLIKFWNLPINSIKSTEFPCEFVHNQQKFRCQMNRPLFSSV